jgi:hypothetical protein
VFTERSRWSFKLRWKVHSCYGMGRFSKAHGLTLQCGKEQRGTIEIEKVLQVGKGLKWEGPRQVKLRNYDLC